jgi:glycosyltransferase involved in cell wall biosynthesis
MSDVEALLPVLISAADDEAFKGKTLLLMDSMGPGRLPGRYVTELRSRRNVLLGYGIRGHRPGYMRRGLPPSRLVWLPAALTYFPVMFPDYAEPAYIWRSPPVKRVFCGGKVWRDWETLRQAASMIDAGIEIVTDLGVVSVGPGANITCRDRLPFEEFSEELAGSSCLALPLMPGRCAGQATLLLAMYMGVPTAVSATLSAREYVRNGRDGLLVRGRDPGALASAIKKLIDDYGLAERISTAARISARGYGEMARRRLLEVFSAAGAS